MININLQQRTVLAIGISLLIASVFTLSFSLWQWYQDWVLAHQPIESAPVVVAKKSDTDLMIAAIPDSHLFGKPPELTKVTDMPLSSLQLQVTGIVKFNTQHTPSKVYISTAGQPSKIYKMGDEVASGVTIHEITIDTVVFDNNGRLEKLPLVRTKLQFKPRTQENQ